MRPSRPGLPSIHRRQRGFGRARHQALPEVPSPGRWIRSARKCGSSGSPTDAHEGLTPQGPLQKVVWICTEPTCFGPKWVAQT
jgi:hypothetical protein